MRLRRPGRDHSRRAPVRGPAQRAQGRLRVHRRRPLRARGLQRPRGAPATLCGTAPAARGAEELTRPATTVRRALRRRQGDGRRPLCLRVRDVHLRALRGLPRRDGRDADDRDRGRAPGPAAPRRKAPFFHPRGALLFSVGVLCTTSHEVGRPIGASRARLRRQVHDSCVGHSAGLTDLCDLEKALEAVRGRVGRLSGLSDFHSKSIFHGALVWARRVLNSQGRWFPARAVHRDGDGRHG